MGFFDEDSDPFESILEEFFGHSPRNQSKYNERFIRGEDEERIIDFLEDEDHIYLVFELPGYNKKDVSVVINGRILEITAKKSNGENIQGYLKEKLRMGLHIKKQLPNFVSPKSFSYTIKNGVLEIVFMKLSNRRKNKSEKRKIKIN